ncbi:MAG TPA: glycosyltransferase family 2 protein [Syntrophobacteraceae bacterium]|nr:glycosyltransferase family 2 protein [Syntrophobacteraceae bacterium]
MVPLLSICIPNWNGREMLRNLLRSIDAHREGLELEVIVADNASTDGAPQMVAEEFPEILLVSNVENLGFARASNQCVEHAVGQLLLFLNNDTLIRSGTLRGMVGILEDDPEIVAVGPQLIGGDGKPQRSPRTQLGLRVLLHRVSLLKWTSLFRAEYNRYRRSHWEPGLSCVVGHLPGAALLVRREAFTACGGWDERFPFGIEDVDLCARLGHLGKLFYAANFKIDHLGRISSRANRGFVYTGYECGYARYLRKHRGRGAAVLYKVLVTMDMPARVASLAIQLGAQRLFGKPDRVQRCSERLAAANEFLCRGMPSFWRI